MYTNSIFLEFLWAFSLLNKSENIKISFLLIFARAKLDILSSCFGLHFDFILVCFLIIDTHRACRILGNLKLLLNSFLFFLKLLLINIFAILMLRCHTIFLSSLFATFIVKVLQKYLGIISLLLHFISNFVHFLLLLSKFFLKWFSQKRIFIWISILLMLHHWGVLILILLNTVCSPSWYPVIYVFIPNHSASLFLLNTLIFGELLPSRLCFFLRNRFLSWEDCYLLRQFQFIEPFGEIMNLQFFIFLVSLCILQSLHGEQFVKYSRDI